MITINSSSDEPELPQGENSLEQTFQALKEKPWIEYAFQQAQILTQTIKETADSSIDAARSRISEIRYTSSAHFQMTLDYLENAKTEIGAYEDAFFSKIKEGLVGASSHPVISVGAAAGFGLIAFKRPRRFLYYNTRRFFVNEESLISQADAKVKELQQSLHRMKIESKKLEEGALKAEEEMKRGRDKLRKAGHQIQGLIRSVYKIEGQASGLKDILGELPRREASQFRSQVSSLASEAKKERIALGKEVSKISNYGLSV
ncbi:RGS1-HXK1-interacting protein 1 [Aristolochia californica]|uniref:RGS1-HXK1-interacting protein 1 n=1 Tax=Aristolochia californica TaxID=171875 RepID=UPI0035DE8242